MSATPFEFISQKIIVLALIAWTLTFSCSSLAQTKNKDPLFAQGKDYFSAGDLNRALGCFRQYEALQPNNIAVHFYIGLILDQTGDSKAALGEYDQCLAQASSIGTDSAELRINMANAQSKLGLSKEALFNYQRAIVIDSQNPLAYLGLSKCLLDTGDFDGALKAIDRYVSLSQPRTDLNVALIRGLALAGQAKLGEARAQLQLFINSSQAGTQPSNPALTQLAVKILSEIEIMQ